MGVAQGDKELAQRFGEQAAARAEPSHLDVTLGSDPSDFVEVAEDFWHQDGIQELESYDVSLDGDAENVLRQLFVERFVATYHARLAAPDSSSDDNGSTAEPSDDVARWIQLALQEVELSAETAQDHAQASDDDWQAVEAEMWDDLVLETLEDEGHSDALDKEGVVRTRFLQAVRTAVGR